MFKLIGVSMLLATTAAASLSLTVSALMSSRAVAASRAVEMACASDYFAHCSQHDPDSAATRNCMRANGSKLSARCVSALVKDGEISKADVERRSARNLR
jgi:hypothetical protein